MGAWSGAQFVGRSADSPLASFPDAAIDDRGRAPVVWDLEEFDQRRPVGILKPEGGAFRGEPLTLAPPRPVAPGPAAKPSVALAASGRATVAWEQSDGEHASILAREFDASGLGPETVILGRARTYVRERPASACRPRGARVLERSPRARLFVVRGRRYGCLLARGKRLSLPPRYAFPPADLAGPLVAFAPDECTPSCRGRVAVMDLRDERTGINRKVPAGGEVWSVVARANGALAWISCPAEGRRRYGRLRQCIRERRVFALDSDGRTVRLLDESHAIDRRSLELRGDRLTWRRGGVRRHARLR
jgi:hypothetical protein